MGRVVKSWLKRMLRQEQSVAQPKSAGTHARVDDSAWWHVMGFAYGPPRSLASVERRFRELARSAHPDRGGSTHRLQQLLQARAAARRQLKRSINPKQRR